MNSKRGLMTVLVGVAMLATPIAAAAKDFKHNDWRGQYVGPAVVTKHDFRHGGTWMPAPAVVGRHEARDEWRENHRGWNDHDADDYGATAVAATTRRYIRLQSTRLQCIRVTATAGVTVADRDVARRSA